MYIYIYIYICIYMCVCVCVCVCASMYVKQGCAWAGVGACGGVLRGARDSES